ncbi:hypothetical protein BH758_12165 [Enterococcus hirae]|nr:hypothetical protein [Enterococcus hirae]EMF0136751.1 hypothetical protein [Enterococcus hirae]EMF0510861.1 hypothetical protein [Enterococcus hirae]EMF0623002.1 hypothetical protein [Enterococcus hirae]OQO40321.1 hypothetical protein BH758_12165 [Enterococcus hirae]
MGCFFLWKTPLTGYADQYNDGVGVTETNETEKKDEVKQNPVTTDVDKIYDTYKDNSFELMTKEKEGSFLGKIPAAIANSSGVFKSFVWSGVKMLGSFNASMVEFLFDMDVVSNIRESVQKFTSNIATNMLGIAGTIGISFTAIVMFVKFAGEGQLKKSFFVFLMTILVFTGLVILKDPKANNQLFNLAFSLDSTVETAFLKTTPVLTTEEEEKYNQASENEEETADQKLTTAGETIAARVFYSNVYEPYLLLNYGTTDVNAIRKHKVSYNNKDYDRINLLLDNDVDTSNGEKIHEKATDYEADKLKNKHIQYYNNWTNVGYAFFYLVVNLIQTVVYFVLAMFRIVTGVMQVFLIPLFPILLFISLFKTELNAFYNYAKAFGILTALKSMAGFTCILFTSFLSFGFQLSVKEHDPWKKIMIILVYLLAPLGIYFFRTFLGSLFTGRVTARNALAFATNPFSTERRMRRAAKEQQKERREQAKKRRQEEKEKQKRTQQERRNKGKTGENIKQPKNAQGQKRSVYRRESSSTSNQPRHKAPGTMDKMAQRANDLHERAREAERQEQAKAQEQRIRRPLDKGIEEVRRLLRKENQGSDDLNARSKAEEVGSPHRYRPSGMTVVPLVSRVRKQGEKVKHTPRTDVNERKRRNGQSSHKRKQQYSYGVDKNMVKARRKQGNNHQQQPKQATRQIPGQKQRLTVPTSIHRESQTRQRVGNQGGGIRRPASVRNQMARVDRVTKQMTPISVPKNSTKQVKVPNMPKEPVSRTERRQMKRPTKYPKSESNDLNRTKIRREIKPRKKG